MEKEINGIKIIVPEGMEIDKENSTFEYIKFKKKEEVAWRNKRGNRVNGCFIHHCSEIKELEDLPYDESAYNVFATKKQAESALAMAQISQIMANDPRFGGVITDEEWGNSDKTKYTIYRHDNNIKSNNYVCLTYHFLAFHTAKQRDLFLKENEDLVKQYLMLD